MSDFTDQFYLDVGEPQVILVQRGHVDATQQPKADGHRQTQRCPDDCLPRPIAWRSETSSCCCHLTLNEVNVQKTGLELWARNGTPVAWHAQGPENDQRSNIYSFTDQNTQSQACYGSPGSKPAAFKSAQSKDEERKMILRDLTMLQVQWRALFECEGLMILMRRRMVTQRCPSRPPLVVEELDEGPLTQETAALGWMIRATDGWLCVRLGWKLALLPPAALPLSNTRHVSEPCDRTEETWVSDHRQRTRISTLLEANKGLQSPGYRSSLFLIVLAQLRWWLTCFVLHRVHL